MFERFTASARRVVVLAQEEARLLDHNYIGTEHLLLGLLHEPDEIVAPVLDRFGLTLAGVRQEVAKIIGRGKQTPKGHIPFTPRAKKVLELGLREAVALHHDYIGTPHLLLGMVREGSGVGAQILAEHSGDLTLVRQAVLELVPAGTAAIPRRRWTRRRSWLEFGAGDEPAGPQAQEELRTTLAADSTLERAAQLAGTQPVGSHHLVLATLADPHTAAARALAALGVDLDRVREALLDADVTGSSDELPEEAGRRSMVIRVSENSVTIEATDPALVELGQAALRALGGEGDTIPGDLPTSASLATVWQALHDSLEDIRHRAAPAA